MRSLSVFSPRDTTWSAIEISLSRRTWWRTAFNPAMIAGAIIFLLCIFSAILAPRLAPHNPVRQNLGPELTPPGHAFALGLDSLGRDVASRLIFGTRISLLVGSISVSIALAGGLVFGMVSGYYGGFLDIALMRITDTLFSFPPILLAMALMASFGPNIRNVMIALGIVYMPRYIRLVRVGVLSVRDKEYVIAARAIGGRDTWILRRHVIPNIIGPVVVQASFSFGDAIIAEAALSFLGVGTQPPTPSWGLMLADAREYLVQAPWYPSIVGCVLVVVVLAINLVGDGVRDLLDPRVK